MKLSVIIPVFNEEKTIVKILQKVLQVKIPRTHLEVIVIDDASTDKTKQKLGEITKKYKNIKVLSHKKNQGKGAAVKTGLLSATGDYVIIQDADLEYDPKDIPLLYSAVTSEASVVYGTRLNRLPHVYNEERKLLFLLHFFGNRFLSLVTSLLYRQWITDMETCYKLFPRNALKDIQIRAKGFEFEPEITAKLLKKGLRIYEVSITTTPRGYSEGKKLHTVRDGTLALLTLIRYRFSK